MNVEASTLYRLRDGDVEADRDAVLAIWSGNLSDADRAAGKYDWFYRQAPQGAPLLKLLEFKGTPVGTCAAGRRSLQLGNQQVAAGVLVDLAVMPDHRSLGPALMLQQSLVQSADASLDLLYGFPNPKAAPVFKRMGYTQVGEMVRYVRVLRHAGYLSRRMPTWLATPIAFVADVIRFVGNKRHLLGAGNLRASTSDALDERVSTLVHEHPMPDVLTSLRDKAYLQWRLDRMPGSNHHHTAIETSSGGGLLAWFCWSSDGGRAKIIDYWSIDPAAGPSERLVAKFLETLWRAGHTSVDVELATAETRTTGWRTMGFRPRSQRPLFVRWQTGASRVQDLHFVAADEDE